MGCVCYLLGRLPPVHAGDVDDEAGAEHGDTDQHAEPQACGWHAGVSQPPWLHRTQPRWHVGMASQERGRHQGQQGHGDGVVVGACCCGAAWQTWQQLLFPSKTKSQSTPVCPVPRQEGHEKPSVGLGVTRIYLRGVLGDAEGGGRYL